MASAPSSVRQARARRGSDTPAAASPRKPTAPRRRLARARRGCAPRTLITLRWLALAGQAVAVLVVGAWCCGFPAPYAACLGVIGVGAGAQPR